MTVTIDLDPRRTDIDWTMKAKCEAMARKGMAFDAAWCPELKSRPVLATRRRDTWRGKFARPKFVSD